MYLVRDIFQLKFGMFKEVQVLLNKAIQQNILLKTNNRILTDFTGPSYRLIFESQIDSLASYEKELQEGMHTVEWQEWYVQFKQFVQSSEREILKIQPLQ